MRLFFIDFLPLTSYAGRMKANTIHNVWDKVKKGAPDECWEWQGCLLKNSISTRKRMPYGRMNVGGVMHYAHRIAWECVNGPIPDGLVVRHRCDNPRCCNPAHLELGTQSDNRRDMFERGREGKSKAQPGEAHHNAKLTKEKVEWIKERYAQGDISQKALGELVGIGQVQIHRIVTGKRWKEVA